MSSSKKKEYPNQVSRKKLKEILREREIIKESKRTLQSDLPEGIHQIREIDRDEGMERIKEVFQKIYVDTIKEGVPHLQVPSRSASNVIYD
ncbi:MAG: hypothetical protein EU542_08660, partial [Promethearchaeota archaeon]